MCIRARYHGPINNDLNTGSQDHHSKLKNTNTTEREFECVCVCVFPTLCISSSSSLAQFLPRSSGRMVGPWPCGAELSSALRKNPFWVSAARTSPKPGDLGTHQTPLETLVPVQPGRRSRHHRCNVNCFVLETHFPELTPFRWSV